MFDTTGELQDVRDRLATLVGDAEPGLFSGTDAAVIVDVFTEIKHLASAGEALFARRVADTNAWKDDDGTDRSAAHWLARRTGTSVGEARHKLASVERLAELPATSDAFRAGKLSDQQAREITAGAVADPAAEADLLGLAERDSLKELRNESRRAQAVDDEEGRQAQIHRRRSLRHWTETDGTFRLALSGTAATGSRILTALAPFTDAAFAQARKEGRRESLDAYAADGLLAMADAARTGTAVTGGTKPSGRNTKVILVVDVEAMRRGNVEHGETCEIQGVGPVPVSTVKDLLGEAALAVIVKDGVDVKNVTHLRRGTTAHQRTVLEYLGLRCNNVGCDSTDFVDIHHVFEFAIHHRTHIDELDVRCKHHHREEHKGRKASRDQLRKPPPDRAAA